MSGGSSRWTTELTGILLELHQSKLSQKRCIFSQKRAEFPRDSTRIIKERGFEDVRDRFGQLEGCFYHKPVLGILFNNAVVYCPTQGGVKPPPLGGGFSVSFVVCGHEQLS